MTKEEYELKKQEKLSKREAVGKTDRNKGAGKKLIGWIIFIIIVALIIFGVMKIIENYSPEGEDFSQRVSSEGRNHIDIGTANEVIEGTYNSNPPTSGPHYLDTAKTRFYDEPVEDQFIIHNLEHGDVWIAYDPRILSEYRDELEDLAGTYVIVSPREANEFDISLVAWNRLDSFNIEGSVLPEQRIRDFILRYDNKGPEQVRGGGSR